MPRKINQIQPQALKRQASCLFETVSTKGVIISFVVRLLNVFFIEEGESVMQLTLREEEKMLVSVAAMVAQQRKDRGLKLNHPEAVALITNALVEAARDGKSMEEVVDLGNKVLTREDVMEGVPEMIPMIQVEATFTDGTKLITLHNPIQ